MLPDFSGNDPRHRAVRQAELSRQGAIVLTSGRAGTNGHDLFGGQFSIRAALAGAVVVILCVCSQEQMVRVATPRIVAAVAHAQVVRDLAVGEGVSEAVRQPSLWNPAEAAVPVRVDPAGPRPTLVGFSLLNQGPEVGE